MKDLYRHFYKMDAIERATVLFREAHDSIDHKRKYTGEPYANHTEAVATIVRSVVDVKKPMGENMVIASLGHDFLEDVVPVNKDYSLEFLIRHFNATIINLIVQLTDVYTKEAFPSLNRKTRKEKEIERLSKIWPEAKTIKLADLIDNTSDIIKNDVNFAKVYLEEKAALLPFLKEGNASLWARANDSIK
jgi:(p)ppGpp synthase/HD superfamily hydrolase